MDDDVINKAMEDALAAIREAAGITTSEEIDILGPKLYYAYCVCCGGYNDIHRIGCTVKQ